MEILIKNLLVLVYLALATSSISMTVTKSYVFRSLRARIRARSDFWGEFAECPYCVGHWLSFVAVAIYKPVLVSCGYILVDLVVSAFAVIALMAYSCGLIFRAFRVVPVHDHGGESA